MERLQTVTPETHETLEKARRVVTSACHAGLSVLEINTGALKADGRCALLIEARAKAPLWSIRAWS